MSRQAGFTLLEVMIAAVLLAVMMSLLLGGMRIGADSWEQGERLAERSARMLVADNFFRSHLSDVKPLYEMPTDPGQAGMPPKLAFAGGPALLEYAGTLPPQVRGGLYKFRLHLAEEAGRNDLKLSLRPLSVGEQAEAEPIEDLLVLENVAGLRFAYYKKTQVEGESQWQQEWREEFLPSLIRIDITLRGEPPWPSIFIAPRAETGQ
jgi:general secretion pathway protein J